MTDPIITLHRYFIHANRMRTHFDALLDKQGIGEDKQVETRLYMELWYGLLYVVIEGWRDLKLRDPEVGPLLDSPHVDLLRRVRNGAFHFQRDYWDAKFLDFVSTDGTVEWVRELNRQLGGFFLRHVRARAKPEQST